MSHPIKQLNLKWGPGIYMTGSGHLRYHSPKSVRGASMFTAN